MTDFQGLVSSGWMALMSCSMSTSQASPESLAQRRPSPECHDSTRRRRLNRP
jgi:hypothetical protein